jgi:hypothetical protein
MQCNAMQCNAMLVGVVSTDVAIIVGEDAMLREATWSRIGTLKQPCAALLQVASYHDSRLPYAASPILMTGELLTQISLMD